MSQAKDTIRAGQIEVRFLLECKDTNGRLAMFEFTLPGAGAFQRPIRIRITTKPFTAWKA